MRENMGTVDRVIRVLLAILVAVLYVTNQISGTAAIVLGIIALIFLLTSLVGFCPLCAPFKISIRREKGSSKGQHNFPMRIAHYIIKFGKARIEIQLDIL